MARYLIITYVQTPAGAMDEMMTVANNLRNNDLQTGSVILDFKKLEVVKATLADQVAPKDWDRIVGFYYQYYEATIGRLFAENGWEVTRETTGATEAAPVEESIAQSE